MRLTCSPPLSLPLSLSPSLSPFPPPIPFCVHNACTHARAYQVAAFVKEHHPYDTPVRLDIRRSFANSLPHSCLSPLLPPLSCSHGRNAHCACLLLPHYSRQADNVAVRVTAAYPLHTRPLVSPCALTHACTAPLPFLAQEFICTDVVAGLPAYLKWVHDSTEM